MSVIETNVIPLFINSQDRKDLSDSSTNFTIPLRKSLRNISSISVASVVIPRTDQLININNDTLTMELVTDGTVTDMMATIVHNNYTVTDLVTQLQVQLDALDATTVNSLVWVVTYDAVANSISIELQFPNGPLYGAWQLNILYSPLVDVIGLGRAGTTTHEFVGTGLDTITVPGYRAPTLVRALAYNITSAALTSEINTSYVNSLAKQFEITSSNNTLALTSQLNVVGYEYNLPLAPTAPATGFSQGSSTAVSDDGDTIVTGSNGQGAWVFTRVLVGGAWVARHSNPLYDIAAGSGVLQGSVVAISGDGNTVAVGAVGEDSNMGAVRIYTRLGAEWPLQERIQDVTLGAATQGSSLSFSTNGNTLAIGAPRFGGSLKGGTVVYVRSGTTWSKQGVTLTDPAIGAGNSLQGTGVALSGDGDTLVVGAPIDLSSQGSITIYTRVASVWSIHTSRLTIVNPGARVGESVAISSDKLTIAAGANLANTDGGVYVWVDIATVWTPQGALLQDPTVGIRQGNAVALSSNGDKLLVNGDSAPPASQGAVVLYTRTAGVWGTPGAVYSESGTVVLGSSVDLDATAAVIAAGAPGTDVSTGGTYIFEDEGSGPAFKQSLLGFGASSTAQQGRSISSSTDLIIVGASMNNGGDGMVVVYQSSGPAWTISQTISDATTSNSREGRSVALSIDNTRFIAGAPNENAGVGATRVYEKNSSGVWTSIQRFQELGETGQGASVAMSNDYIIVGCSSLSGFTGGAFIYHRGPLASIWSLVQTIVPSMAGPFSSFGNVSIGTTRMAISGPGNAYVYELDEKSNTWNEEQIIAYAGDIYTDISRTDTVMVIGAPSTNSAYTWTRTGSTWTQETVLQDPAQPAYDQGAAVAISPNGLIVAVGSPEDKDSGILLAGLATYYERDGAGGATLKRSLSDASYTNGKLGGAIDCTNTEWTVGAYTYLVDQGIVFHEIFGSTTKTSTLTYNLTPRSYSIFDMENNWNSLFEATPIAQLYSLAFDGTSSVVITALTDPPSITGHRFFVDNDFTTVDSFVFVDTFYASTHTSIGIDFSINNDILKTVVVHMDNADNVLYDPTETLAFRKYSPGYSIDADVLVDIQLRDERDRIVDLNGGNWIMTVLCTVNA